MSNRKDGLVQKYTVSKVSNPSKKLDCIVLEFDDPIARKGIEAWAEEMKKCGYHKCAEETHAKLAPFKPHKILSAKAVTDFSMECGKCAKPFTISEPMGCMGPEMPPDTYKCPNCWFEADIPEDDAREALDDMR